jgi:hypothetical protein
LWAEVISRVFEMAWKLTAGTYRGQKVGLVGKVRFVEAEQMLRITGQLKDRKALRSRVGNMITRPAGRKRTWETKLSTELLPHSIGTYST